MYIYKMMIIKRKYNKESKIISFNVDAYDFHASFHDYNCDDIESLYKAFTVINEGLKNAYRSMCNKHPDELPTEERFMELLNNTIGELKDE